MRKHRNTSYHCETVLCTHSPVPCLLCLSMLQWRPMTRNGINYTRQFLNLFMILHNFVFPYAASHLPGIVSSPAIHLLVLVLLYFHFFPLQLTSIIMIIRAVTSSLFCWIQNISSEPLISTTCGWIIAWDLNLKIHKQQTIKCINW